MKTSRPKSLKKSLDFSPSIQHCKNTGMMVQCSECDKWRLVFSKKKLKPAQKNQLDDIMAEVEFNCGLLLGMLTIILNVCDQ